jgi:c-di-GMP-binding flagellar brake protein YcgR
MQERRQIPRWQLSRQARIRLEDGGREIDGVLEDIALKGMKLSLADPLPAAPSIRLSVMVARDLDLELEVSVAWSRSLDGRHVYGMRFERIKDRDKDGIFDYVRTHCARQVQEHMWAGTTRANA